MRITVNGEPRELEEGATLDRLAGRARGIAIALNGEVVPVGLWPATKVSDADAVEVVTAHQGG